MCDLFRRFKRNFYSAFGFDTDSKQNDGQYKVTEGIPRDTKSYVDESGNPNPPVNIPANKKMKKDELDIDSYLPQEKESDWFETMETVDVKNPKLINIYRPIGVNTINSRHGTPTYDIKGLDKAVCPKFVVSPWLQSSVEPDESTKSLCA